MAKAFSDFYFPRMKRWHRFSAPLTVRFWRKAEQEDLNQYMQSWSIAKMKHSAFFHVWHFLYEHEQDLLAIELIYQKNDCLPVPKEVFARRKINLKKIAIPKWKDYKEAFERGYQYLLDGECYQFNLTARYQYQFSPKTSFADLVKISEHLPVAAFAHRTYLQTSEWHGGIISNSPECLFTLGKNGRLASMPIKGTIKNEGDDEKSFLKLKQSAKDQAELYMITDLIRNDLSRIEHPCAQVLARKKKLVVPGIVHQYSLVDVPLSKEVSLAQIWWAMFPGGSITGAPKKRVMEIIADLESCWHKRGFYTGSTLFFGHGSLQASINIRTAELDFKTRIMSYGAGGGITLKSSAHAEFREMKLKAQSFLSPFVGSAKI